ncbi:hypothetical protein GGI12_000534 [Dipsacomyces acuminosporus]|nr:hypothetical protein GGI12_000534 [Dipsacomyces acuminosporus]
MLPATYQAQNELGSLGSKIHQLKEPVPTVSRLPSKQQSGSTALTPNNPLRAISPSKSPSLVSKKKTRIPLQAIHIRALAHGWRVPVGDTPLSTAASSSITAGDPAQNAYPSCEATGTLSPRSRHRGHRGGPAVLAPVLLLTL